MKVAHLLPYSSYQFFKHFVALASAQSEGEYRYSPGRLEVVYFFIHYFSIRQVRGPLLQ